MKKLLIPLLLCLSLSVTGCNVQVAVPQNTQSDTSQASAAQSGSTPANTIHSDTQSTSQLEYYFTRAHQHPEQALETQINSAKTSLDIAIYSITKTDIVSAIMNAKKRGVAVRIITDRTEANTKAQKAQLKLLSNAGIPIKENTHPGLMHMKVSIIDKAVVTTGSYNYSQSASTENDEVLVVIHNPAVASSWAQEFQTMWDDSQNYTSLKLS